MRRKKRVSLCAQSWCVKMLCDPVLLSAESVSGVELFRSLFSPLKPASLTLYQAVDLSVNRWLGFCPTIIPVSPKLWCGWLGKLWLRRDLSTLPSIKILHYLQYFLVFFKTFRPCCFSYLRPAVFCTFQVLAWKELPTKGQEPLPPQLLTCGLQLPPLLASGCPSKQNRVKP